MTSARRPPAKGRTWKRLLTLIITLFLMVPAAAAQAHDVLESSDPADGSTVHTVPAKVGLTFDHTPIAIGSIVRVKDPSGTDQADGSVEIIDNHVTQAVKANAPQGKYTVVWRVVSSDGHPIEGTFTFTADAASTNTGASASAPAAAANTGSAPQVGLLVAGAVGIVLLLALIAAAVVVRRRLRSPESED